jgi:Kef-type K+ transport system membrane component KefB
MAVLLILAWVYLHSIRLPVTWPWVLGYAAIIAGVSELIYYGSQLIDDSLPIHIEVLLPAFVLGCVIAHPPGHDPHVDDAREGHQEGPESESEQRVSTIVSACFMVLVGLSMPAIFGSQATVTETVTGSQPMPGWGIIALHVIAVTIISNLGKMFPLFCYRKEATWRERLAVSVALWPRGEVGAGVLIVSLSYGIGGPVLTVALLSLALNIALTGFFILWVKHLLAAGAPVSSSSAGGPPSSEVG